MNSIVVTIQELTAASLLTAKKGHHPNPAIKSVLITTNHIVASNSYAIIAIPHTQKVDQDVLIPAGIIKDVGKIIKDKKLDNSVTIEVDGDDIIIKLIDHEIKVEKQYSKFPKWERVIPEQKEPVGHPDLDYDKVAIFCKIATILGVPKTHASKIKLIPCHNSLVKIVIWDNEDIICGLMPLRNN